MKIALVGEYTEGGIVRTFERAFTSLGHAVATVDEWAIYRKTLPAMRNRYLHRLFWKISALLAQKNIIEAVVRLQPDLILIFKGFLIAPRSVSEMRKELPGAAVLNYNPDNPFNTWHHGNANSWIKRSISLYDAYFIWGKFLIEPLVRAGARRVEYLPFGYDAGLHRPTEISENEMIIYGSDVAFIGSWDKEREEWLNHLADFDLKIWGNAWEKSGRKLIGKWQKKPVIGDDFSRVCNAAKIIINIVRQQNLPAHNMRTFEVPACGGFMLATRTAEQEGFFAEGKEADYFSSPQELRDKIVLYLKNEEKRKAIAAAGYRRSIFSDYSYEDRAKKVVEIYSQLKRKS